MKFDVRHLLDDPFVSMAEPQPQKTDTSSSVQPIQMNWADPFRPDDVVPDHVKSAMIHCLNTSAAHYTYPTGDPVLLQEVAKRVRKINGLDVDPERNILISGGSDNLFFFVMRPFLVPGKMHEVMMPIPSYSHNFTVPTLMGALSVEVPTYPEDGYDLRIDEFEKRVSDRTRMVVITNPNNPTSTVYRRETLEKLADFVIRHDLILVVDQAFEDTVYDGHEMCCIATFPGMAERTILLGSISKGMALCGFRVAYAVASETITRIFKECSVFFLGAPNTIAQAGAIAALQDSSFVEDYRQEYMERARILSKILEDIPHISFQRPESSFIFWVDISWYGTDRDVSEYLAKEANILVSSGSMCGDSKHIRIIFGVMKDRQKVIDAVLRIKDALERHPKNRQ